MEPVARISLANQKGQQSKMKIKQILYHVRPLVSNDGLLGCIAFIFHHIFIYLFFFIYTLFIAIKH